MSEKIDAKEREYLKPPGGAIALPGDVQNSQLWSGIIDEITKNNKTIDMKNAK